MKKFFFIAVAALAALAFASCSEQEQPEAVNGNTVFTATIEQDVDTKTILSDLFKVFWSSDDQVSVNGCLCYASPKEGDASVADFKPINGEVLTAPYIAVYPALLVKDGVLELPEVQSYKAGSFNAPMYAQSQDTNLNFKNICGLFCFSLKGTDKIKSISITANEPLCGTFTMLDGATMDLTGEGKTVTLDCGEGVVLDEYSATKFYIYLPPKTYSAGLEVVITNTEGITFSKTTIADATIARSNIYTFNWTPEFIAEPVLGGEFSVSAGKKVHFSRGNLYFDGSEYQLEKNQYSYSIKVGEGHESYFTWKEGASNVFFTNETTETPNAEFTVAGMTGQFRTLSSAEWQYLFNSRANASKLYRTGVRIGGTSMSGGSQECIVIAPDSYTGTILSWYSITDWNTAQAEGLVCLPAAGYKSGSVMKYNEVAAYWSSSANGKSSAYDIYCLGGKLTANDSSSRNSNYAIRLVAE